MLTRLQSLSTRMPIKRKGKVDASPFFVFSPSFFPDLLHALWTWGEGLRATLSSQTRAVHIVVIETKRKCFLKKATNKTQTQIYFFIVFAFVVLHIVMNWIIHYFQGTASPQPPPPPKKSQRRKWIQKNAKGFSSASPPPLLYLTTTAATANNSKGG